MPLLRTAACSQWVLPKVDPELWGRLFAYQREGVLAGVRFGGRVLYADEMGLGKTVQVRRRHERGGCRGPRRACEPVSSTHTHSCTVPSVLLCRTPPTPPNPPLSTHLHTFTHPHPHTFTHPHPHTFTHLHTHSHPPPQACCLIKAYYGEDVPVLVVTPKSLRETWADALYMVRAWRAGWLGAACRWLAGCVGGEVGRRARTWSIRISQVGTALRFCASAAVKSGARALWRTVLTQALRHATQRIVLGSHTAPTRAPNPPPLCLAPTAAVAQAHGQGGVRHQRQGRHTAGAYRTWAHLYYSGSLLLRASTDPP